MTSLCNTCSVEHATDNVRVECSKRGFVQPQTECPQYKPTREVQLEKALRELCDSMMDGFRLKIELHSDSKETIQRVAKALTNGRELLGKGPR